MRRPIMALEVTPATYDEIAAKLGAAQGDPVTLGGVELQRGPIPPLLLTEAEIDTCYERARHAGTTQPRGFARLIEFSVLRRLAQRRK